MSGLTLHLTQGEDLLGTLVEVDSDFPWRYFTFTPTSAFERVKPLFDRALASAQADDWEQFDQDYQAIQALGLRLVDPAGGIEISDYLLHIDGDTASLRY